MNIISHIYLTIDKENIAAEDMAILRKAYEHEEGRGAMGVVQNTLVDYGLTMYLHTSFGGAVWGACEALRRKGINMAASIYGSRGCGRSVGR
jgi:hypothetical protein